MSPSEISDFRKQFGLGTLVRSGAEDFKAVGQLLQELIRLPGWNICYKFPGQDPKDSVGAAPGVWAHLSEDDLFLFVQDPLQSALLTKYGVCCATDPTHSVLSYNKVKLISVQVASYHPEENSRGLIERGHVVAVALVNSEREDVQAALLSQILKQTGTGWSPKVLMTDLAFAAFNAWKKEFPELNWRFCNFHVWQAWTRKIDSLSQPQDMAPDDFKQCKYLIKSEIHSLLIKSTKRKNPIPAPKSFAFCCLVGILLI